MVFNTQPGGNILNCKAVGGGGVYTFHIYIAMRYNDYKWIHSCAYNIMDIIEG